MGLSPENLGTLIQHLRIDEGIKLKLYKCSAGKVSIGIGRNLEDNGISMSEAEAMCAADIRQVEADLDRNTPWWKDAPAAVQIGLANMCFNMGWPTLSKFKNMLAALKDGKYAEAADHALDSAWAKQVGKRAERIAELFKGAK